MNPPLHAVIIHYFGKVTHFMQINLDKCLSSCEVVAVSWHISCGPDSQNQFMLIMSFFQISLSIKVNFRLKITVLVRLIKILFPKFSISRKKVQIIEEYLGKVRC